MIINNNWRFCKEGGTFEEICLPHDAMLSEKRNENCRNGENSGYFEGGKYIYEKLLAFTEKEIAGKNIQLYFEGVYQRSKVYCNDQLITSHDYGFTPFYADITSVVKTGENRIRVYVDNSLEPNCRWYSGSGIYRNVHLLVRDVNYIDEARITTLSVNPAKIRVDVFTTGNSVLSLQIKPVDQQMIKTFTIDAENGVLEEGCYHYSMQCDIDDAKLWSVDEPNLYECLIQSRTDHTAVRFGIRSIRCNAEQGLLINGKETLLRGGCIHSDNGILGACTYRDTEYRKVKILKEAGYNAIRCAHNPASKDFLDACDQLGMMVLDEAFDGWYIPKTYHDYSRLFEKNWKDDLKAMVATDYNHPCVIMQSIGNEVCETIEKKGVALTKEMTDFMKSIDGTRPITAGINVLINVYGNMGIGIYKETKDYKAEPLPPKKAGYKEKKTGSAFFNATAQKLGPLMFFMASGKKGDKAVKSAAQHLDVLGVNYGASRYDEDVKNYPNRVMVGSETIIGELPYNWQRVKKHKAVIGDFAWAAWDYLGEAGVGDYMYYSYDGLPLLAGSGAVDLLGHIGAEAVFEQIVWGLRKEPYLAVAPLNHAHEIPKKSAWRFTNAISSWNWPGYEGVRTKAEVYSDADEIQLYLNDQLLGRKKTNKYRTSFTVAYQPGELKAVAIYPDHQKSTVLCTTGHTGHLEAKTIYKGDELSFIEISAVDENGHLLPAVEKEILVECKDNISLLGLGSARTKTDESYLDHKVHLYRGQAMAIIRGDADSQVEGNKIILTKKQTG